MTKTPAKTYPTVSAPVEAALEGMDRAQLLALLGQVSGQSAPAIARADDSALRNAIRTYIRMGRLTADQVLAIAYPITGGDA